MASTIEDTELSFFTFHQLSISKQHKVCRLGMNTLHRWSVVPNTSICLHITKSCICDHHDTGILKVHGSKHQAKVRRLLERSNQSIRLQEGGHHRLLTLKRRQLKSKVQPHLRHQPLKRPKDRSQLLSLTRHQLSVRLTLPLHRNHHRLQVLVILLHANSDGTIRLLGNLLAAVGEGAFFHRAKLQLIAQIHDLLLSSCISTKQKIIHMWEHHAIQLGPVLAPQSPACKVHRATFPSTFCEGSVESKVPLSRSICKAKDALLDSSQTSFSKR